MPTGRTKTERMLDEAMEAHAGDPERVLVLERAKRFKRTWIELAEVLVKVREGETWLRWGFRSFDDYCGRELRLKRGTVDKLCASYGFLRANAPRLLRDEPDDVVRPVPSWQAVDFVARAEERGAASEETLDAIKRAAFDEGIPATSLSRRFREVAFPVDDGERRERARAAVVAAARRMADLIADPDAELPVKLASDVEALMGELLRVLQRPPSERAG
jgi:hypothetical protein